MDLFDSFYDGRRVFITGHTGFKGGWLSCWLSRLGSKVTGYALDNRISGGIFDQCGLAAEVDSITGDVRDFGSLKRVLETAAPEIVFHMAAQALVRVSYREPVETYQTNVMGTANLLQACRSVPSVRAIVIVTSDKCYENREWVWGYREIDPLGGHDPYGSSKACAELVTNSYLRSYFNPEQYSEHHVGLASVRAGNIVGGGDWAEDRLVPDCMRSISHGQPVEVRSPQAVRPWQHVLEPLRGYLLLAKALFELGGQFSGAWNFGPDDQNAKSVRWVVDRITKIWGAGSSWRVEDGLHPHEANYLQLDCCKAKKLLGWHPAWDLERSLQATVNWYREYFQGSDMRPVTLGQIERYSQSATNRMESL